MSIVSFDLEGDFAAFRDPSVTTNQTVTVIPSKSALIGLLGALLGVKRSNSIFDGIYSDGYIDLIKGTAIGIKVRNHAGKCTFFTNHRSLKEAKTKPYKTELLVNPKYTIYVKSTDEVNHALLERLKDNRFVFSPMLGHAYCPARICNFREINGLKQVEPYDKLVSTVFLDEITESKSQNIGVDFSNFSDFPAKVLVERHLHHYILNDSIKTTVLRHYIPVPENGKGSVVQIDSFESALSLAKFFAAEGSEEAICLF
ncbi:MAG: CRISPR-associated protein Cas5 [Candidatus Bathyarchaeia archaeon]